MLKIYKIFLSILKVVSMFVCGLLYVVIISGSTVFIISHPYG